MVDFGLDICEDFSTNYQGSCVHVFPSVSHVSLFTVDMIDGFFSSFWSSLSSITKHFSLENALLVRINGRLRKSSFSLSFPRSLLFFYVIIMLDYVYFFLVTLSLYLSVLRRYVSTLCVV